VVDQRCGVAGHPLRRLAPAEVVDLGGRIDPVLLDAGLPQRLVEHLDLAGDQRDHEVVDRSREVVVADPHREPLGFVDPEAVLVSDHHVGVVAVGSLGDRRRIAQVTGLYVRRAVVVCRHRVHSRQDRRKQLASNDPFAGNYSPEVSSPKRARASATTLSAITGRQSP
jgi:hypothetical protein